MRIVNFVKEKRSRIVRVLMFAAVMIVASVNAASAALADDITNITTVITGFVSWIQSVMAVFMQPPLVIFVGITIGGIIFAKVRKLMKGK